MGHALFRRRLALLVQRLCTPRPGRALPPPSSRTSASYHRTAGPAQIAPQDSANCPTGPQQLALTIDFQSMASGRAMSAHARPASGRAMPAQGRLILTEQDSGPVMFCIVVGVPDCRWKKCLSQDSDRASRAASAIGIQQVGQEYAPQDNAGQCHAQGTQ